MDSTGDISNLVNLVRPGLTLGLDLDELRKRTGIDSKAIQAEKLSVNRKTVRQE